MRKENSLFNRKNFKSEDASVKTQAACLNRIFQKINEMGLSQETLDEVGEDIEHVSKQYHIDSNSTVLLAAILEKTTTSNQLDDEDLARYLGCTNIEFLRFHKSLHEMDKAGIIQMCGQRGNRICYRVTSEMLKAVENEAEFIPVPMTGLSADEIFSRFRKHFGAYRYDSLDVDRLLEELDSLVRNNDHLVFCKKALESSLYTKCSETERRIFYYLCHRYVSHGNRGVSIEILTNFTSYFDDDERLKRVFTNGNSTLQQTGLVTFAIDEGMADTETLSLSDTVMNDFLCEIEIAPEPEIQHKDLVKPEAIKAKDLFFNKDEGIQINRLADLLCEDTFKMVQKRLESSGMRKGFNAIFYGAPGTGKTASAFELARRTGREIFCVDMSQLRSKWVGDSEKSVRYVFQSYRKLCRTRSKAPIMFFNEADAIFSKRLDNIESSVDQMNNSIQNIILEEMENLEGILIATTNLLSNLDPAFERRFIYKVEFKLPEKESRAKIWKSMIPDLSEAEAASLADKFSFSGGNIENIARKSTVDYILYGEVPNLQSLEAYCREEILNRKEKRNKIGF